MTLKSHYIIFCIHLHSVSAFIVLILLGLNLVEFRGVGATGAAVAAEAAEAAEVAALALPVLCGGIRGQKVPFGHAQKCILKNDKIKIKNLKTAYS